MKFVFCLLCCAAIAAGHLSPPSIAGGHYARQFEEFKEKYNKIYRNELEIAHRFMVFVDNVEFINEHNKEAAEGKHTFTLEVNKYADLTHEEFKQRNNLKVHVDENAEHAEKVSADPDRPDSIDWRDYGYVNTPQNQGSCGSCWTFSSTGSMEGAIFKKTGTLWDLSKQNLVDCEPQSLGCEGGYIDAAFEYGIAEGVNLEENYPYTSGDYEEGDDAKGTCEKKGEELFVSSYEGLKRYDEEDLTNNLATVGPISIAIDAGGRKMSFYKRGVHYDPNCGYKPRDLNHAVVAVGYGTDKKAGDYYIVKNSWGADWGDDGFIKMARNKDNNCGVATDCSYPIA